MIVDVHAHCWPGPDCFSPAFRADARRMRVDAVNLVSRYEDYRAATAGEEVVSLVFGGKARLTGVWIDDAYVARDPARMIGFMSLDLTQDDWEDEMREGRERFGFRGIKLLPMYAGFYPQDARLDPLWRYASRHNLPVLLHTGTTFVANAPIDCTLPRHLDRVAIRFPDAKIILAHLGHPYEGETDGSPRPVHGFHTLPDGTLTPLHVVMAIIVAHDGTIYATTIYSFTLLKIESEKAVR